MRQTLKRLLPWILTLAILAYLGLTTDFRRFVATLGVVDPLAVAAVAVIGTLCVWLADCLCLRTIYGCFFKGMRYRDFLVAKGTSYFLNVVNYNAGAGGVALFISRRAGIGFLEALGTMLFLNLLDVFALASMVGLGLIIGPNVVKPEQYQALVWICAGMAGAFVLTIAIWAYRLPLIPRRFRELRIFHSFRTAKLHHYPLLVLMRMAFIFQYVLIHIALLEIFSIPVPFTHLLFYLPLITFVAVIPISVAGLGTTQVAWRELVGSYPPLAAAAPLVSAALAVGVAAVGGAGAAEGASGLFGSTADAVFLEGTDSVAVIDAFSTTAILVMLLARVALGSFTVRSTVKDFVKDPDEDPERAPAPPPPA